MSLVEQMTSSKHPTHVFLEFVLLDLLFSVDHCPVVLLLLAIVCPLSANGL